MPEPAVRIAEETETREYQIAVGDLDVILTRHVKDGSEEAEPTVLLLHGASASSYCFWIPRQLGLIDFLLSRGADVWTLDWRGSNRVSPLYSGDPRRFTLDKAAKLDLPVAVENIRFMETFGFLVARDGECWLYDLELKSWVSVGTPPQ